MSDVGNRLSRIAILLLPIALGACAQYSMMNSQASTGPAPLAWDGAGRDPNLAPAAPRRVRNASRAVAQSPDDTDALGIDADESLARKLVICRACIAPSEPANSREDVAHVANR
ncbi:hypothetical protein [Bradyrhizobium lablabi]|uniref:hypothetical protein n=1 Tax=Bradyrhizobium lablabi TaxID=722472 RepID=UPI001BACB089|nr:hypothetical protein [Bradyrhizobium lablabi]MBR0693053.1 hypothetical protein [Bradyrhizobium lablabi]